MPLVWAYTDNFGKIVYSITHNSVASVSSLIFGKSLVVKIHLHAKLFSNQSIKTNDVIPCFYMFLLLKESLSSQWIHNAYFVEKVENMLTVCLLYFISSYRAVSLCHIVITIVMVL